ncbi:M14 family zinc carboxypeptidase [Phenylobacterium sp.]|uniref:M14 family zinc carboxypeptidase n=1 Tax=Phenylobacterium sp. TaxID=1871053 RepID=UPI002D0D356D|nr:M14 family zinc carboxypeptidase [Phenylobacterium sp.]HLZ74022.1 M14 family zinc carboxypeptidase [Phenylobacterium sp.]
MFAAKAFARAAALSILLAAPAFAQQAPGPQVMDPTFAEHQKAWTTKPEFSSPLVDHLPASSPGGVPSPRDVLGHDIGAPRVLDHYADLLKYYRALAAKSPRVKIVETGKTEEGRPTVVVLISSDENIAGLEANRKNLARLADPRGLSDAEAKAIIAKTKPMYLALGGLHSAETGPPEMLMELAYRLVTEDSPLIQTIRKNVIVGINPASDPDGRDRYADWYYRNKIDDTDDLNAVPGAPYWGKYIFHDNNRDINYSGLSARNLLDFYLAWHPPVMHDLHESVPFLYTFSGQAPQNPTLDPILFGEMPWIANFEMAQLTKYGMPGVWTHGYVDEWSPGYVGFMSTNHNGLFKMYETFGNGGATTELRHVKAVAGPGQGDGGDNDQTKRDWFRPDPPYKVVEWSMRNNTNYMETGVLTGLTAVAENPQIIVENFYAKSRNSIEAGRKDAPYAFLIPGDQADMTRAALVVNLLRMQGIEVGRTTAEVTLKEGKFPAGSFIVKRDQPYGRLAKILLEKQVFPDNKLRTYDDSAWSMGMMAHVKVTPSADLKALDVAATPVDKDVVTGSIGAAGAPAYAVLDQGSVNFATLRYRLKGEDVRIAEAAFKAAGKDVPAGSFIVDGKAYEKLKAAVVPLGLTAVALSERPGVATHEAALPRLAVYSTWGSTQNVGWVRYAFDQYETPYDLIFKDEVRKGGLRARYDVIVVPSQGRSSKNFVFDIPMTGKPLPYTRTAEFPTQGAYGSSPDIRGGLGLEGVAELRKFVEAGGTLITLGDSSAVPGEFGIAPEVEVSRPTKAFYAPGPIVTAKIVKPANPVFYGYTEPTTTVRWASTALLSLPIRDQNDVLMSFPGGDKAVQSGLMVGASEIKDRPAIVDLPVGQGQVLMFATNPIYRWQNFGEYRMLYNALFSYKDLRMGLGGPPVIPDPNAPEKKDDDADKKAEG